MIILVKKLNDDALNFIGGGLFTNPKKIEEKKLDFFKKKKKDESDKIKSQNLIETKN